MLGPPLKALVAVLVFLLALGAVVGAGALLDADLGEEAAGVGLGDALCRDLPPPVLVATAADDLVMAVRENCSTPCMARSAATTTQASLIQLLGA